MDGNDQRAIETLFDKLSNVERQSAPRDAAAEAFIRDRIGRQPGAPYYMAQTIVVQEQALNAAQARIEELEEGASRSSSGGGLFSGLFGTAAPRRGGSVPRVGRAGSGLPQQHMLGHGSGGGFLAGAAQTAMGVAGGVLIGNAIGGMLFGEGEAEAAEPDAGADDTGIDAGGDFGDMGF